MDICTDYNFLTALLYIKYFINIGLIVLPFILIVMGAIDGFKATMSGNTDDVKKIAINLGKRVSIIFIILLLPSVMNIIFTNIEGYTKSANRISLCFSNADQNIIAGLRRAKRQQLKEMFKRESEEYIISYNREKLAEFKKKSTSDARNVTVSGQGNFTTYNLTESQLKGLAALCKQEQGTPEGAAAEASLMANLFELQGQSRVYGEGADGLYKWVENGGWFANAGKFMNNSSSVPEEYVNVVKTVLVDGKRILPGYVDEHDCFSDISSATNNGTSINKIDRNAYTSNVTKIQNVYGSNYTFYSFPTATSDPFGYTKEENRSKLGDDCYSFAQLS